MSFFGGSGFAELLFAEEGEEPDADDELHDQRDPEPSFTESVSNAAAEVRKYVSGADCVRCSSPC